MRAELLVAIERLEADNAALTERAARLRADLEVLAGTTRTAAEREAFAAETARKCEALRREAKQLRETLDANEADLEKAWHAHGVSRYRNTFAVVIRALEALFKGSP